MIVALHVMQMMELLQRKRSRDYLNRPIKSESEQTIILRNL